jgi:hypothetical protein
MLGFTVSTSDRVEKTKHGKAPCQIHEFYIQMLWAVPATRAPQNGTGRHPACVFNVLLKSDLGVII